MSGADRKSIRAACIAALFGSDDLAAATRISPWADTIDASALPAYGVGIVGEDRDDGDLNGEVRVSATLLVVIKAMGRDGEADDALDDLSDAVAAVITDALLADNRDCALRRTKLRTDFQGGTPVGTATLEFGLTYWEPAPTL